MLLPRSFEPSERLVFFSQRRLNHSNRVRGNIRALRLVLQQCLTHAGDVAVPKDAENCRNQALFLSIPAGELRLQKPNERLIDA